MSQATLRRAFIPASREEREGWGPGDFANEINDATDTGNIGHAEMLLSEFRRRFLEIHPGYMVRVANPGTHGRVQRVLTVTDGKVLLASGQVVGLDRVEVDC